MTAMNAAAQGGAQARAQGDGPSAPPVQRLILRRPDDWHVHVRDGAVLSAVVPHTARCFGRAIIMPNLTPPVTDMAAALAYRARIMAACPPDSGFSPLMTCYLTDDSNPQDIARGFAESVFTACKLYPAHATTNSAMGVTDIAHIRPVLAMMERCGMPLLVHGEVTDPDVDVFDREAVFISRILAPLLRDFPGLKCVLEHITTKDAVDFVSDFSPRLAATITPHHLIWDRNDLLVGGVHPHAYCLPILKRATHKAALRRAAVSGNPKFFLGTDSAPHHMSLKESACGCAGIFNAPHALEHYAMVFDEEGALDRLEGFASLHGPLFYGLPPNEDRVMLERSPTIIAEKIALGDKGHVVPFRAGARVDWRLMPV